jgi:hypothetical protein
VADGWCWFVLREKYCWLVAGGWFVLREKYCWLMTDKRNEQGGRGEVVMFEPSTHRNSMKLLLSLIKSPF